MGAAISVNELLKPLEGAVSDDCESKFDWHRGGGAPYR